MAAAVKEKHSKAPHHLSRANAERDDGWVGSAPALNAVEQTAICIPLRRAPFIDDAVCHAHRWKVSRASRIPWRRRNFLMRW